MCYFTRVFQGNIVVPEGVQPWTFMQPVIVEKIVQQGTSDNYITVQRKSFAQKKAYICYFLYMLQSCLFPVMFIL